MEYKLRNVVTLHQQGKRSYNEDFLFPEPGEISVRDRLFMVCDGVGGSVQGDQASRLVSKHFSNYMLRFGHEPHTRELLTAALRHTEQELENYIQAHPDVKGTATTLTFLSLTEFGVTIAWAGDSRVYHIRNNRILYRTKDHSLVNALIDHGEITEEEARVHPKRNTILRAVTGREEPTRIDVYQTDDVAAGDYFLLCSDGILEAVSDSNLLALLQQESSLEAVCTQIDWLCEKASNDNYTMILLQLENVVVTDLTWIDTQSQKSAKSQAAAQITPSVQLPDAPATTGKNRSWYLYLLPVIILFIGYQVLSRSSEKMQWTNLQNGGVLLNLGGDHIYFDAVAPRGETTEAAIPLPKADYFILTTSSREVRDFLNAKAEENNRMSVYTTRDIQRKLALPKSKTLTILSGQDSISKGHTSIRFLPFRNNEEEIAALIYRGRDSLLYVGAATGSLLELKDKIDFSTIDAVLINTLGLLHQYRLPPDLPPQKLQVLPPARSLSPDEQQMLQKDYVERGATLIEQTEIDIKF